MEIMQEKGNEEKYCKQLFLSKSSLFVLTALVTVPVSPPSTELTKIAHRVLELQELPQISTLQNQHVPVTDIGAILVDLNSQIYGPKW